MTQPAATLALLLAFSGFTACAADPAQSTPAAAQPPLASARPSDWPAFMAAQDMRFTRLPRSWQEAPHFGNAMVGSMLHQAGDALRLQVFRADVQDHRDDTHGWPGYSRPRLLVGHFTLQPAGKPTGCAWRKDLWNAELTGTVTTTKGEIKIRHFVHADDMAIVTEITPSAGEKDCAWTWHPAPAKGTRDGYPTDEKQIQGFAKQYGAHYAQTLKVWQPNPAGRRENRGGVAVWIQDLLAGGQYATAWTETQSGDTRTHVATIAHTHPAATAAADAVADVRRFADLLQRKDAAWPEAHRAWWHAYYQQSFVHLPDPELEALYWQTIYRYGATSRQGRAFVDTPGLWFQGGRWCYTTTDWNIQAAHWGVYAANRVAQGAELLERFHAKQDELAKAVRPAEWQADSAYLPLEIDGSLVGNREQDMRYYHLVGCLPWTVSNFWMQYRFTMDDALLRDKVYPLLRRSINLYLHMLEEGPDGKLHLPPTYSPESGIFKDCNFDLALLKWGCHTLLKANQRLGITDPLAPRWKEVIARTPDFPADEHGFRLGADRSSDPGHRHLSHLLMIYPLHLVNVEQAGAKDVLEKSLDRANRIQGLPAMVQTHAAPIAAHLGRSDDALKGLQRQAADLYPNGLWYPTPCLEASLGVANTVQEMLLQSWSDPTKDEDGLIRIFPACPDAWRDVAFDDLRAEGAFLVGAGRKNGQTAWVRIKSLAGEPCRVRPNFAGAFKTEGARAFAAKETSPGIFTIDLKKGEEVVLRAETRP